MFRDVINVTNLSVVYQFTIPWVKFWAMLDNAFVIFEVFIRQFIWLVMPARRTHEILMLRKELQVMKRSSKTERG